MLAINSYLGSHVGTMQHELFYTISIPTKGSVIKKFKITGFKHIVKINTKCTASGIQCEQHELL